MEFTFDVNELLRDEITKINSNMIPPGFSGDRRKLWDSQSKLSDIINVVGQASAAAQGLTKPITTADKLRNSEHTLYMLVDHTANKGKGRVLGLLKMGRKGLYVFDRGGQHHQLQPLCVLDFYVHESMQRHGLGRKIFEHMLQEENIEPVRLAIDRPSDKFLGFLKKHYGLTGAIPQMNNFVVFDGFFSGVRSDAAGDTHPEHRIEHTDSHASNTTPTKAQNGYHSSPYGRYGAPRPTCSMGQIIHNHSSSVQPTEPSSEAEFMPAAPHSSPKLERPRSLSLHTADEPVAPVAEPEPEPEPVIEPVVHLERLSLQEKASPGPGRTPTHTPKVKISERENNIIPAEVPLEYSPRTPSNLTDQGFLDLKFYHSRLW